MLSVEPDRLLVVEDDPDLGENLLELVESQGYSAEVVGSAEAALACIESGRYRGVITDYRLPGCSGVELIRALRAQGSAVPVVIMSAFLDPTVAFRAEELGALAVLQKPVDLRILLQLAREFFEPAHAVLIVEDNLPLAENLAEALASSGIAPFLSASRESALSHRALPPVALIDLHLPDGDGFQVAQRLAARNPALKVVFVTAHADLAHERALQEPAWSNADLWLKPFDMAQLIRKVEGFVTAS